MASSCSYGNESFSHGDKWNLDSCTSCECNNGTLNCFQEPCSISSDCPSGKIFIPEGECCPVCSTECQASNGQIYSDGEVWQEGPCKRCRCDGGQSKCTSVQCLAPDCPNPIFLPDECCPFCPGMGSMVTYFLVSLLFSYPVAHLTTYKILFIFRTSCSYFIMQLW